jgi:hypothetical protein
MLALIPIPDLSARAAGPAHIKAGADAWQGYSRARGAPDRRGDLLASDAAPPPLAAPPRRR